MSYDDPEVRPLLDLEGLKAWMPGRTRAMRCWRAPSTGSARSTALSTTWEARHMTALDLGDSASTRAGTCSSSGRLHRCRSGGAWVRGTALALAVHLRGWCRAQGHGFARTDDRRAVMTRGSALAGRWRGAERAGTVDRVVATRQRHWGLAARGALVEAGAPGSRFRCTSAPTVGRRGRAAVRPGGGGAVGSRPPRSRGTRRSASPTRSRTRSSRS